MEADMPIIVHFDGKIIKDYTGSTDETKDRLCILMTHEGETHLLDVPGLAHGLVRLSLKQFRSCRILMILWICGIFFDTTASYTGRLRGTCMRLAHFQPLLMLACRHHVGEVHIPTSILNLLVTEPLDQKTNCLSLWK